MTAFVLQGVTFADVNAPSYQEGDRIRVVATVEVTAGNITSLNAEKGAAFSTSVAVTSVTYTQLRTGATIATLTSPGNITLTIAPMRRGAADSYRLLYAQIGDYTANCFAGTAYIAGWHEIGDGVAQTEIQDYPLDLGDPGGFLGRYYNNLDLVGEPVKQLQEVPNFHVPRDTQIYPEVRDDFSARWTGAFKPALTGLHRFLLRSDDGCRLFIDGNLVIDSWVPSAGDRWSGWIDMTADTPVSFRLEFFDRGAAAHMEIEVEQPGLDRVNLATLASRCYPSDGSDAALPAQTPPQPASHYVEIVNRY